MNLPIYLPNETGQPGLCPRTSEMETGKSDKDDYCTPERADPTNKGIYCKHLIAACHILSERERERARAQKNVINIYTIFDTP